MKQNTTKFLTVSLILAIVSLACQVLVPAAKELNDDIPAGEMAVPEDETIEESDGSTNYPDLIIYGWASMPITGPCLEEYLPLESKVCVRNKGDTPAGNFTIETGEDLSWQVESLGAGEDLCFETEFDLSGSLVVVDPDNAVREADETNNELIIPVPTPPVLCPPESQE